MTEIKSASDEEMAYSAKGNSDGNNGGLPQQGQAPQAAPKPYMLSLIHISEPTRPY